jgi:hypothetical protein
VKIVPLSCPIDGRSGDGMSWQRTHPYLDLSKLKNFYTLIDRIFRKNTMGENTDSDGFSILTSRSNSKIDTKKRQPVLLGWRFEEIS